MAAACAEQPCPARPSSCPPSKRLSNRPRILAWLVVLLSNIGGLLMYGFVRDLFSDRRVALFSLVLYLLVPGKLYFFPLLNTVTPTVLLLSLWLSLRWIRTARYLYAAGTGAAVYGLLLFEPLPLVMGVVAAPLALSTLRRDGEWSRFAATGGPERAHVRGGRRVRPMAIRLRGHRDVPAARIEAVALQRRPRERSV
mgnify:CR=1 FL=1